MTLTNGIASLIGRTLTTPRFYSLFMEQLIRRYTQTTAMRTLDGFEEMISNILTDEVVHDVEAATQDQADNQEWRNLRLGRITASILFEVAHCDTQRGK